MKCRPLSISGFSTKTVFSFKNNRRIFSHQFSYMMCILYIIIFTKQYSRKKMNFADTLNGFEDWKISSRYQISRCIGSGSYGEVVEGMDTLKQIPVAIKRVGGIVSGR
jgi:hypothetical protein